MKILVTTPITHINGALNLLKTKGEVFLSEEASKTEVRKLLLRKNIDVILCNPNKQLYKIDEELLQGSSVKLINTCSTGTNHIDLNFCKGHGIKIYSLAKDYDLINQLPSTAEHAFSLMLSLLKKIPQGQKHASKYHWDYLPLIGRQIKGLNIGLVGHGRLGQITEEYCRSFNANVYIYDPPKFKGQAFYVERLETLFKKCEVIFLHVHVSEDTKYMINKKLFPHIQNNCYIINTSRGEIVNETDIVHGLRLGKITGYASDVVEDEFENLNKSTIIKAMNMGENIIITPHIGGMTREGQEKAYKWAINKLK